jgi:hypothetical protein
MKMCGTRHGVGVAALAAAADEAALEEIGHGAAARESIQKAAIAIDAQAGDTLLQEASPSPRI